MSPIAWFIISILLASALCLLFARVWFKPVVMLYAVVIAFILSVMIHYFIGWGAHGSPLISKNLQRRIAHTGYYFNRDGELKLLGESVSKTAQDKDDSAPKETVEEERSYEAAIIRQLMPSGLTEDGGDMSLQRAGEGETILENGFVQPKLAPGESLTLKPNWVSDKAADWTLSYKIDNRPLRLKSIENGKSISRCVNIPPDQWLNQGDTIFFTLERGGETRFVSIKWSAASKYPWPFTRTTNAYDFGEGIIRGGVLDYKKGPDLLMSERVLIDGLPMVDLVKRSRKEFRSQIGILDQEWWDIFSGVVFVRELRGDTGSRIGILIAEETLRRTDLKVYRNYSDGSSQPLAIHNGVGQETIPTTSILAYGFPGSRKSFELALTNEVVKDAVWNEIVHVSFERPTLWTLPPSPTKDFIITSSNDYIPLDGYFLDIGNSSHAFYAKARLNDSLDELNVNDGRNVVSDKKEVEGDDGSNARRYGLSQSASLGDYKQGVLIALVPTRGSEASGVPYSGSAATALIVLNALFFVVLIRKQKNDRPKLILAWTLIWGMTLTLLIVRFILAYRVSLVPPLDATLAEIRNVFDKGVVSSLVGLSAFAIFTPFLLFANNKLRWKRPGNWLTALAVMWGLIIAGYTVAGSFFGINQSFLGIRISIADHLMIVGGLALLAMLVKDYSWRQLRWLMALVVFLALGLQILVVKDTGSIVYFLSLLPCIVILWDWDRPKNNLVNLMARFIRKYRFLQRASNKVLKRAPSLLKNFGKGLLNIAPLGLLVLVFVGLALVPHLLQTGWMRKVVRPAFPETTFYRFASFTDSEDAILMTRSGDEDADMSKLLNNSRQDWQMLLYASHGASSPVGYGQAPLSKIGMTYATSVSDCAFSTYLLAEHGKAAAFLILSLYLLLACSCMIAGWYLSADMRHRNVALVAIGAFFACNAFYMAGANVGLFPFTGQNLPLLGLNSGGDLLQGLALAWLAGWLLLGSAESDLAGLKQNSPVVFRVGLLFFAVLAVGLVAIGWRIGRIGNDERYREDHNFKPKIFNEIEGNLPPENSKPSIRDNAPLVLNRSNNNLEIVPGGQIMEVEEQYKNQFNERTDKFNPNGGLYYLERSRDPAGSNDLRVRVNRHFFYARSPFSEPALWRGQIVAGGENDPAFYALNKRWRISLREGGFPGSVDLAEPRSQRTNSSVRLYEDARQFFELKRDGDQVRLDTYISYGRWSVFVDGKRVSSSLNLAPLSIIVIESRDTKYRRNLIYLGPTRPILAYVRWRNGEQRRMFPEGGLTLVYLIGKAGDQAAALEAKIPFAEQKLKKELTLTLDVSLHQELQQQLTRYARNHPNYNPFRSRPNRLAVTVMDAFSGQVLALPGWPTLNSDDASYESLIDRIPEQTRYRTEENHNLTPHAVGSTIKPIIFATMATALRQRIYLEKVKVYNRANSYSGAQPAAHPHLRLGGIKIGMWDCNSTVLESDMRDFIVHSRDFPEGMLGMLGMIRKEEEVNRVLIPNVIAPDLTNNGRGYVLDMANPIASKDATAFSIQDQFDGKAPGVRGPEVINSTILFRGLASVFDFDNSGLEEISEIRLRRACGNFLPTFNNQNFQITNNNYLDNVIPPRPDMGRGSLPDIRGDLISCLLGGGNCRFNNIMMAEAGARLATGQRVFARLEESSAVQFDQLPDPLGNPEWRNTNIIKPMELVGEIGTAKELRKTVKIPPQYRVIYKTGTILEGNEGRESETLMFIIGRWENSGFVKGETVAGFLYMEKSKARDEREMKKFDFADQILNRLIAYLELVKRTPR